MKLKITTTTIDECEENPAPQFVLTFTPEQAEILLEELPETPYYDSTSILRGLLTRALELHPAQPI